MIEAPSAASGSSRSGAAASTPPKSDKNTDAFALYINQYPPTHIYTNEIIEFEILLESSQGSGQSPPANVSVIASLEKLSSPDANIKLELLEDVRISPSRRTGRVKCQVLRYTTGTSFQIKVSAEGGRGISPCYTPSITVVQAKLHVQVEQDWGNVWYKDEGGRDKCLEAIVTVKDKSGVTLNENLSLHLSLYYSGTFPTKVSNQELLRLLGSEKTPTIDRKSGKAKIRFRIEDVSKNHQGQEFIVKISVITKGTPVIAPAYTPAVSVRSKRNKRQRPNLFNASGRSSATSTEKTRGSPPRNPTLQEPLYINSDTCRSAIQNLSHWSEDVVNSLYPLQWQVIGYAQNPDGSTDYSRPYYSMQNPTTTINRIMSSYTETVRDQLQILHGAIEQSAAGSSSHNLAHSYAATSQGNYEATSTPVSTLNQGQVRPYIDSAFLEYPIQQPAFYTTDHDSQISPQKISGRLFGSALDDAQMPVQQESKRHDVVNDLIESKVEYVLAKQFKSLRTGERLGFPAYSSSKEIIGFYQESTTKVGVGKFVPINDYPQDFGPFEIIQATRILEQAIAEKNEAVHALKDWGSISNLINHCLVYDFSKDIGLEARKP